MTEKPIIFSTAMVQAILAGNKTMTRGVVKPQPVESDTLVSKVFSGTEFVTRYDNDRLMITNTSKPYCRPGDVLWVREAFGFSQDGHIVFRADGERIAWGPIKWRPSIHLPRKYARIFLRVTNVRCERVQDITPEDCCAEGVYKKASLNRSVLEAVINFRSLWDSLNAKRSGCSWGDNPWVWCISFEKIKDYTGEPDQFTKEVDKYLTRNLKG